MLLQSYYSADCDSDLSLVCCKIRLQPKQMHRFKPEGQPHINASKMLHQEKAETFVRILDDALPKRGDAKHRLDHLRETLYNTYLSLWEDAGEVNQLV